MASRRVLEERIIIVGQVGVAGGSGKRAGWGAVAASSAPPAPPGASFRARMVGAASATAAAPLS